jgi:WD40-like Beta Propeller Repeat
VTLLALGGSDCEAVRDAVLGQPANALSSLAYVVAAGVVVRRGGPRGPGLALAAVGAGSFLYHGPMPWGAEAVHNAAIVALVVLTAAAAWRRRALPRPPALAVVALAAAVSLNLLGRTGAPLCRPDSLAQPHAAWHVLTAVAAAAWLTRWPRPVDPPSRRRTRLLHLPVVSLRSWRDSRRPHAADRLGSRRGARARLRPGRLPPWPAPQSDPSRRLMSTARQSMTAVVVTALGAAGCGSGADEVIGGSCRNEVVASVDDREGLMTLVRVQPGGEVTEIAVEWPDDPLSEPASRPDFSPDGERMVVVRADGDYESAGPEATWLWTLAADGSDPRPVTSGAVYDDQPDWSPDGTTIAFTRYESSVDGDLGPRLMLVDAAEPGPPRTLLGDATSDDRAPRWSPDGRRLAFIRVDPPVDDYSPPETTVMVVDADGAGLREIATVDDARTVDWLPNGAALLVSSPASGRTSSVHLVDVGTGESRPLIAAAAEAVRAPSPSSDEDGGDTLIWYLTVVDDDDDDLADEWRLQHARLVGDGAAARVEPLGDATDIGAAFLYGTLGLGVRPCR